MKRMVFIFLISLIIGTCLSFVVLGLNLPSNDPTHITTILLIPVYFFAAIISGNPHAPSDAALYVGSAILFSVISFAVLLTANYFWRKNTDGNAIKTNTPRRR